MCDPISAATSGLSMASGLAGYAQQSQAAARQNQYYAMNKAAANQALVNSYAADQTQLQQERNQASQNLFENEKKSVAAQGTAVTAAGQASVGGLSVDELIGDYQARQAGYQSDVDRNFAMDQGHMAAVEQSQQDGTISRINSVQQAVQPSWLDAGLRIAGSAVQGLGQYQADQYRSQAWKQNPGAAATAWPMALDVAQA